MIGKIKSYIQSHDAVTIPELIMIFEINESAIRDILGRWINTGKIRKIEYGEANSQSDDQGACATTCGLGCSTCHVGCKLVNNYVYSWIHENK